jgi:hypothetical protein
MEKSIEQFEKSGLALKSDLDNDLYRELFTSLENDQKMYFGKSQLLTIDAYLKMA